MNDELVRWRLEKAENTYQEGLILFKANLYNGAINRFYYAAFHGMRAVLATKSYDAPKHSGVISLFNKHFVKPGYFSKYASKVVTVTFSERSNADYNDFKIFNQTEVERIRDDVKNLIDEIRNFLQE